MQRPPPDPAGAPPHEPDEAAAALYVEYLTQRGSEGEVDFDSFCSEHADSADELRRLHSEWRHVDGVLRRLGISDPGSGTGGGATAVARVDTAIFGEVLARLAGRTRPHERYDVEGEIASGGMGSILRVWDKDLRRHLAMKVVLQRTDDSGRSLPPAERALGRFIEEAQVTGQLDHPGIVPVHELGLDHRGSAYFTMQLVRGRDLEHLIERVHRGDDEEWTQARALNVLLRVCDAMAYAHAKGVIHRDLKPANVMIGRFGEVYVMDWGLARVLGQEDPHDLRLREQPDAAMSLSIHTHRRDLRDAEQDSALVTLDGDVIGTPAYMSPEQARGDLEAMGPASDIYSLGAILYHLLAGHMPYKPPGRRLNAMATWGLVQAGSPPPLHEAAPAAPAELVAICEKAMAREPGERYADMPAFARDLRAFLEGRVVRAYETGAVAEFKKWVVRNRALATTGFAAGLLIVAGLSFASVVLAKKNEELVAISDQNQRNADRASAAAAEAEEHARIAEDRADTILRLADGKRLEQLRDRAEALWPAFPELADAYRDWIAEASELVGRLELHRSELEELRRAAQPTTGPDGPWTFASTELEWHHDALADLVSDLEQLAEPGGLLADMQARLQAASTISERTIDGPAARERWQRAIASIASVQTCPAYGGLELPPQMGLLPIGRDPRSDLWEFADLQTGDEPRRDPTSGELQLTEGTGLVFVLLPGGRARIGSQARDPNGSNYVPDPRSNEAPPYAIELAPFFLSKYEMTQGQWLRFTKRNPSFFDPSKAFLGHRCDLTHPVETVSWTDCERVLGRLGMRLPTEAQWEYAARAGTDTPWFTGSDPLVLEGYANLADRAAAALQAQWPDVALGQALDDGWAGTSPVGTFEPNAFGLHDVHGNVWEWCADSYESTYASEGLAGDGLRFSTDSDLRVNRGGSCKNSPDKARSAYRNNSGPGLVADVLGVRPARPLQQ